MKRRGFIKLAAGVSIFSLGTYSLTPSFNKVIKKIIKKETNHLKIAESAIDQFIAEANKEHFWERFNGLKELFIKIHYFSENSYLSLPYSDKYNQYKDSIVGQFLLSTDFFRDDKTDKNKKVSYTGFYNPYKMPCLNPFSNLYHEA